MEDEAPQGGDPHVPAVRRLPQCGDIRPLRLGVCLAQPTQRRARGRVADGPPAARVGAWAEGPGGPTPSEARRDTGLPDAK